jgi:hypothetical protein
MKSAPRVSFVAACLSACAALSRVSPAQVAADALAAEAAAHTAAVRGCAAYEAALVAGTVKADADVSGKCATLRD